MASGKETQAEAEPRQQPQERLTLVAEPAPFAALDRREMPGDVVATETADDPSARLGADLTYQNTVHLRAGYIANDTDGANAALGFGLGTGRLLFDIARTFGGLSEDAGKTPAYVSLRFTF